MKNYFVLLIILLFGLTKVQAQDYEYLGFLKLPDSTFIAYKVAFSESKGMIKGYSYTDTGGAHETKSVIVGRFDDKKNTIEFREVATVYTKSDVTRFDFCYVYFTGRTRKLNDRATINGSFKGFYDDLTSCIDGKLELNAFAKIKNRTDKFEERVKRSRLVADSIKEKVDVSRFMNRFVSNSLKGGEKVNVIWEKQNLKMQISDPGTVDNDKIAISLNGKEFVRSYALEKNAKTFDFNLAEGVNTIVIKAINEGTEPGNTAKLMLLGGTGETINLMTSLKVGEEIQIVLYKQRPTIKKK